MKSFKTLAGVVAGIVVAGCARPGQGASVPAASPSSFVGSQWRLTTVAEGSKTTAIPDTLQAGMGLSPGGDFLADDSLNAISGKYTVTGNGFDVQNAATTEVGYAGTGAAKLAAIAAFRSVGEGSHVTVVSVDGTRLVTQAGDFRLTFTRTGNATDEPLPSTSSAPNR